jgi:hypothetical protein
VLQVSQTCIKVGRLTGTAVDGRAGGFYNDVDIGRLCPCLLPSVPVIVLY